MSSHSQIKHLKTWWLNCAVCHRSFIIDQWEPRHVCPYKGCGHVHAPIAQLDRASGS